MLSVPYCIEKNAFQVRCPREKERGEGDAFQVLVVLDKLSGNNLFLRLDTIRTVWV